MSQCSYQIRKTKVHYSFSVKKCLLLSGLFDILQIYLKFNHLKPYLRFLAVKKAQNKAKVKNIQHTQQ